MRFIQADIIYPISSKPVKNGILVLDDQGKVEDVLSETNDIDPSKIESNEGSICPGFINAHCHLELSHMKGAIPEKTGLVEFAKGIIGKRNAFSKEETQEAMRLAD